MKFATQTAQLATNSVRVDTLNGREHVVAPVAAVREMVLKGELLTADEIEAAAPSFNGRPLPIGHPQRDGEYVSANEAEIWDTDVVGWFFDAHVEDSALVGEVWVDIDKSNDLATNDEAKGQPLAFLAQYLDDEVRENIEVAVNADADSAMEVSTAYWYVANDQNAGTHDGEDYSATQHALKPDHLALLPNGTGECSVSDGCGVYPDGLAQNVTVGSTPAPTQTAFAGHDDDPFTTRVKSALAHIVGAGAGTARDGAGSAGEQHGQTAGGCACDGQAAHNCDCNMEIETLAEATGLSVETLEAMSDEERDALVELADNLSDAGSDDGTTDGAQNGSDAGTTQDDAGVDAAALKEELKAELREELRADEREEAIAAIEANTDMERDSLESLDTDSLVSFAEEFGKTAQNHAGADYAAFGAGSVRSNADDGAGTFEGRAARLAGMEGADD